jgi:DNA (cytosine-5)-methyltransferase 1
MSLTVGSLCSGIGGLDLGLERAGMRVLWQCEIDDYCSRVLAKHWPNVPNYRDIKTIDWSVVDRPDLICAGYPCQPFSLAGVRRGETDPRHLWPFVFDAIRTLRPRFAILENVPGHRSMGFGRVLGDLAEIGFDAQWESIPATFVGAPHIRDRVFIVAYADIEGEPGFAFDALARQRQLVSDTDRDELRQQSKPIDWSDGATVAPINGATRTVADAEGVAEWTGLRPSQPGWLGGGRSGDSGRTSNVWTVEPDVGRVADGVPSRVDRLRGLGNAVVPQVAEFIGRQLIEAIA